MLTNFYFYFKLRVDECLNLFKLIIIKMKNRGGANEGIGSEDTNTMIMRTIEKVVDDGGADLNSFKGRRLYRKISEAIKTEIEGTPSFKDIEAIVGRVLQENKEITSKRIAKIVKRTIVLTLLATGVLIYTYHKEFTIVELENGEKIKAIPFQAPNDISSFLIALREYEVICLTKISPTKDGLLIKGVNNKIYILPLGKFSKEDILDAAEEESEEAKNTLKIAKKLFREE